MDTDEKFLKKLQEIFAPDAKETIVSLKLDDEAWDSLALLAVTAAIDDCYSVVVPMIKLKECSDVQSILCAVREEQSHG